MCQDARIQDLYFNISEMKLSITSLFLVQIMSYLGASDIVYSVVIGSFLSEILKYKSWILASWCKRSWIVRLTPYLISNILSNHTWRNQYFLHFIYRPDNSLPFAFCPTDGFIKCSIRRVVYQTIGNVFKDWKEKFYLPSFQLSRLFLTTLQPEEFSQCDK